jgi:hypothetical protein
MDAAVQAATRECIQRLAFLWDAELPGSPPTPAATPDFHQEYYLYKGHSTRIREWLSGEHERFAGIFRVGARISEPVFVDITPPWLSGLSVAQALPSGHAPLCFGWGHPLLVNAPPALMVHPVA